jgi:hypothetical protein
VGQHGKARAEITPSWLRSELLELRSLLLVLRVFVPVIFLGLPEFPWDAVN